MIHGLIKHCLLLENSLSVLHVEKKDSEQQKKAYGIHSYTSVSYDHIISRRPIQVVHWRLINEQTQKKRKGK